MMLNRIKAMMSLSGSNDTGNATEPKYNPPKKLEPPKTGNFPVKAFFVGVGSRGGNYIEFAWERPDLLQVVGIADYNKEKVEMYRKKFNVSKKHLFTDWRDAVDKEKFADCVVICTPDKAHKDPAVAFAKKGYHMLLEKPMAVSEDECEEIAQACRESGIIFAVGHVLRYHPKSQKVKELISSGAIGQVASIELREPVGYWHFAHSYVRGNWRNESESTFSLMAKSCHDLDLLHYWMAPAKCVSVSSFGSLTHFKKENKPEGAGDRCLDCPVESTCPYSAKKLYLSGNLGWPSSVVVPLNTSIESLTEALKTGPYGRCVYECDNDVNDNQVVSMQFCGGQTARFVMMAFTYNCGTRSFHIYGSKGEIEGGLFGTIRHHDFATKETVEYNYEPTKSMVLRAHGSADYYLFTSFLDAVAHNDHSYIRSGLEETLTSHKLVFAAERARKTNSVVNMP